MEKQNIHDAPIAHESRDGTIYREIVHVEDVDEYQTYVAIPHEQRSSIAVAANVAYLTGLDGHNLDSIHKLLHAGIPSIFIDAEGSHKHETPRTWNEHLRKAAAIRLGRTALATNAILGSEQIQRYEKLDHEYIVFAGESRGAMSALASEARHDSPTVLYSDPVAPAMLETPTLRELLRYAQQVPVELGAAAQELSRVQPSKIRRYLRTIKHPLSYAPYAIATAPALIWSNLGKHIEKLPTDTPRTITVFDKDHWSQPERWEQYFADHQNTEIVHEPGRHLKLIRPAITLGTQNRIRFILHEIEQARRNSHYDFEQVAINGIREYRRLMNEQIILKQSRAA